MKEQLQAIKQKLDRNWSYDKQREWDLTSIKRDVEIIISNHYKTDPQKDSRWRLLEVYETELRLYEGKTTRQKESFGKLAQNLKMYVESVLRDLNE